MITVIGILGPFFFFCPGVTHFASRLWLREGRKGLGLPWFEEQGPVCRYSCFKGFLQGDYVAVPNRGSFIRCAKINGHTELFGLLHFYAETVW